MSPMASEWLRCRSWIEDALEYCHGTHTIEDVERGISSGHFGFWPAEKSAAVTEFHEFPRARNFHVFLAGGDLEELMSMVPMWQAFAARHACGRVTLCGRRGWERALKKQGWEAGFICLDIPSTPEPQK